MKINRQAKFALAVCVLFLGLFFLHKQLIRPHRTEGYHCSLTDASFPATTDISSFDEVTLERSVCYGPCQPYKVDIHGDGKFEFATGRQGHEEKVSGKLADRQIARLLKAVNDAGYFLIPNETGPCVDPETNEEVISRHTQVTSISIAVPGKKKMLAHGCCAPPKQLKELEDTIDDLVDTNERLAANRFK
jgi:hypothetical protein